MDTFTDSPVNGSQCVQISNPHVIPNVTSRDIGVTVSLECEDGYELSGIDVLTCEEGGFWSGFQPICTTDSKAGSQVVIIIVCAAAAAVALGVLLGALYMVIANCRKERKAKAHEREFVEHLKELRIYQTVTQDSVGMPPVIYDNMHTTLRGRSSLYEEKNETTQTPETQAEVDMRSEKAFIY